MREIRFYSSLPAEAKAIREEVFVVEQGFDEEFDEADGEAVHALLFLDGHAIAVGRILIGQQDAYFGRLAVVKAFRGKGYGTALLRAMEEECRKRGFRFAKLHSQLDKAPFYEKCGYARLDDEITPDQGYPHVWMGKRL